MSDTSVSSLCSESEESITPPLINLVTPEKKEGILVCKRQEVVIDDSTDSEEEFITTARLKRKISFDSQPVANLVTNGKKLEKRFLDSESTSNSETDPELEKEVDLMKDIGCVAQHCIG